MFGINHLHAHYASEPTTVVELVSGHTGIPYSFTTHAKDLFLADQLSLTRSVNQAQFVLTCTKYNQHYLRETITAQRPIHCVYHGIDIEWFKPTSTPGQPPPEAPLILSIGRFREKKGFPTLIQACAGLRNAGIPFRCVIIGYGPMQGELEAAICREQLQGHIQLVGKMTREGIREWYERA
ncbi:MAG: glycosyltransferase, partial [Nitrospira sp.]|nr:glycosyltransferase [Nitrospira sp.]